MCGQTEKDVLLSIRDSTVEQKNTDIKGLKKLKTKYAQLAQTGKYKKYR